MHAHVQPPPSYRGRFAPSPTGNLHLGSLMVAVAVALQAQRGGGEWLLRIEDVDRARRIPGADQRIRDSLHAHGLNWQGEVWYQSERDAIYQAVMENLLARGLAFDCACSRADLGPAGIYPGHCRAGLAPGQHGRTVRLRLAQRKLGFCDLVQGWFEQDLSTDVGDFVIRRADHCYAYQLAVVVDDAAQGVTEVVRGADLLDSTPRQLYLQEILGYPQPEYLHLPLLIGADGHKLSKRNFSDPLDDTRPLLGLGLVMALMGHRVPSEINELDTFWRWAVATWNPARIPRQREILLGHSDPAVILRQLQQESVI